MRFLKLLFIRHAQSVGNQQRRMQGLGDFELSDEGKHQAEKLGHRLFTEAWRPTVVYTSPLRRAVQTTEILLERFLVEPLPSTISDLIDADEGASEITATSTMLNSNKDTTLAIPLATSSTSTALTSTKFSTEGVANSQSQGKANCIYSFHTRDGDITVEYADELQEHQNGIFQGLTWAEAKAKYPELCEALESSSDWIPIPGAESLQDARDRAQRFIHRLLDRHIDGENIWIVTHSWIMQHLISELLGCDRSWRFHAHNTALFEFWLDRSRWQRTDQNRFNTDLWQIRRFNDYHHLV